MALSLAEWDRKLVRFHIPLTGDVNSRVRLTFTALVLGLATAAWLTVVGQLVYDEAALHLRGVIATTDVTAVHDYGKRAEVWLPAPADRSILLDTDANHRPRIRVGDQLEVRYDPADPRRSALASEGFPFLLILFMSACASGPGYLVWRDMTRHRRSGTAEGDGSSSAVSRA